MGTKPQTLSEFGAITWKEKIAYIIGETGSASLFYFLILTLSTYFYTDVMHISAVTVGTIVVVSRIFDGISDLVVGSLVDRTHHKMGKALPWVLWTSVPYALSMFLLYCVPASWTTSHQVAYVIITYNLAVTICYTLENIPWGMLPSLMSRDKVQRSQMYSIRLFASQLGSAVGVGTALPIITKLGGTQDVWIKVMGVFAVIGIVLNLVAVFTIKERVKSETPPDKNRLDIPSAIHNPSWWIMILITTLYSVFLVGYSTILPYFCDNFFSDLTVSSTINTVQTVTMSLTALACYWLTKKYSKSALVKFGMIVVFPGQVLMILNPTNYVLMLISTFIRSFGWGLLGACMFSMTADAIEYGHWYTGHRAEGTTYSAAGIGNKLGVMVGGGVFSLILGLFGYDGAAAVQTASALGCIKFLFIWSPLILAAVVLLIMFFYPIDKNYNTVIEDLLSGKFRKGARYAENK